MITILNDRQMLILQMIIDEFTENARPVGSRAIAKKEAVNLSAATIRNVMADLEDLGYIEKMHSSSGRIPAEKGYRYYVDHVITPSVREFEKDILKQLLTDNLYEFEHIVQTSAEVLSQLTNYTAIILGPHVIKAKLKQIQIVVLSSQSAVAILVTDTGHVEHKSFTIPYSMDVYDLEIMVNILNDRLSGVPLVQLAHKLETEVYKLMQKHLKNHEMMYKYIQSVMTYDSPAKLYVGGQANLLIQPEFQNVEKMYDLYTMLEDEQEIIRLLSEKSDGITVTIGEENENNAIKNLSLITSSYKIGLGQFGTIALLGPTRMKYRKVIHLLKALSHELSDIFYSDEKNDYS